MAGNPTKISLTLLPNAIENEVSEFKPTKSPTIIKANSWTPIPAGIKKATALIIPEKDSIMTTSIILGS